MNKADLIQVLKDIGAEKIKPCSESPEVECRCPLAPWRHSGGVDNHPSFAVRADDEGESVYNCFGCGSKGTLSNLIQTVNARSGGKFEEVMDRVHKAERRDLSSRIDKVLAPKKHEPEGVLAQFEAWSEADLPGERAIPKYAMGRGISLEIAIEFELRHDPKEHRLVFPVRRMDGALVGATGRALRPDTMPRYRDYRGFEKGKYLYGEHKISSADKNLVVVEGFVDALKLRSFGWKNVVATMGARITNHQLTKIRNLGLSTYLMQDGDKAGMEARRACISALRGRVQLFDVPLPPDGDPDELPQDVLESALANAKLVL